MEGTEGEGGFRGTCTIGSLIQFGSKVLDFSREEGGKDSRTVGR